MVIKKQYIFLIATLILVSAGMYVMYTKKGKHTLANCTTEQDCRNNQNCQCYCSEKGDFRKKDETDDPVWVENDKNYKNGKPIRCYCKQWDLKKFPGPVTRSE